MKYSLCLCVYNEHEMLPAFLRQIPDWMERVLILVSERPWFGMRTDTEGLTLDILKACRDPRVEIVRMHWKTEQDQRNWGLGRLSDFDWTLILDADEFFTPEQWDELKATMDGAAASTPVIRCPYLTYWKTFDYVWSPPDSHKALIAVRPKMTAFFDKREVTADLEWELPIKMHHLSWVKSDAAVKAKISNWMHARDFDTEAWYNGVWLKWTPEMENIAPYGGKGNIKAVFQPLPESIKKLFF